MTSDFPYYLALFGLLFFISVICCCIKLIDIIDRPVPRPNTMPAWNYANYLQNSPVAVLSPQPDPYLRCAMLAENHGLTVEEYLTASATGPGLYTSTSRDAISSQYGNSVNHNLPPPPPPAPAPSPNPMTPPLYRISVPETTMVITSTPTATPNPSISRSTTTTRSRASMRDLRADSLREQHRDSMRDHHRESGMRGRRGDSLRERSTDSRRDREYPPKYEDICFDV